MKTFTTAIDWTSQTPDTLVERPGPGKAPTAFRIWRAGANDADGETIHFTVTSAELLMAEQAARGRVYSFDFDHLSVRGDRPAEAGRASGWHRLAVRLDSAGQPELWAVEIEWCADAKAGLEEQPPKWRFFSPAFLTNPDTGEVTSYVNCALCINPRTHQLPALAAQTIKEGTKKMAMKAAECAAMLQAMADATDDPAKKEALAMARAAFGDDGAETKDEQKTEAEGDPAEEKKDEPATAAEGEEPKVEEKTEAKTHAADLTLAREHLAMKKRLDKLEIEQLIDKRPELTPGLRGWCLTQTLETVRGFLGAAPKEMAVRGAKAAQGDVTTHAHAPLLEGHEREEMDKGMGMNRNKPRAPERLADGRFVIHTMRPSDVRTLIQKGQV